MGVSVYDYQSSEASSSTTGGWNTAENQDPSTVNDGMRAHKQNVANFLKDQGGTNTTGGSANAHTVTLSEPIATTVPTNFFFTVKFGFTNTSTTVNLNVNSIGNARVKVNYDGVLADPIPGDLRAGAYGNFIYDGTYFVLLNAQQQARYAPGTLYGLTLSNNGSDATNDIDIAVGSARDGADSANMDLLSTLTKQLDAAWAVGTNAGGLDTGSVGNNTYYIWLIKRPDTGIVDVLFSLSSTAPTMPTNYTLKRAIGQLTRSGAANSVPIWYGTTPISGTWTPSVGGSATYTLQVGQYVKIGKLVHIQCHLTINAIGTGSTQLISGLPFAADSTSNNLNCFAVAYWQNITPTAVFLGAGIQSAGSTNIEFYGATAATANLTAGIAIFKNTAEVILSGTYVAVA